MSWPLCTIKVHRNSETDALLVLQAGLVGSHPVQKEQELQQMVNRNPYQHALLCIHQAQYQPDKRRQAELLQVWYCSALIRH